MNTNPAVELGPAHQLVRLEYGYPACRCGYTIEPEPFDPASTATYDAPAALREVLEHVADRGGADLENHDSAIFAGPTEWDLSGTWQHDLKPDSNGDPVCKCGWDPSNPRTTGELVPATQLQAAARVRAHLNRVTGHQFVSITGAVDRDELTARLRAAGALPHPNPAPHLTAQQRLDDARAALHAAALEYAAAALALNTITEPK